MYSFCERWERESKSSRICSKSPIRILNNDRSCLRVTGHRLQMHAIPQNFFRLEHQFAELVEPEPAKQATLGLGNKG